MLSLTAEAMTPQDIWAPVLLVVGVVGCGLILTLSIRSKIARRNRERPSPREMIEHVKAARHRSDDAQALAGDLADTARRLSAQLDNKAQRLEALIRQADERIELLSEAEAAAADDVPPEAGDQTPEAAEQTPAAVEVPPRRLDPLSRAIYEQSDAGLTPVEIAQQLDEQVGKVELILALREA